MSRSLYNSGFEMLGIGQREQKGLEIGFMIWSGPEHPDNGRQKSGVEEEWWSLTGLITA